MITVQWTDRAQSDLDAIHAFIAVDSRHYAAVVIRRLLHAVDRLHDFPQSGRLVPEFLDPAVREVIVRPYRIVSDNELHVLTVHHGSRGDLDL